MVEMLQLGALSLTPNKTESTPPKVKKNIPAYRIAGKGFFDDKDKLWHPGQALYWEGEPNEDMIPLNKLAYDKLQVLFDKLDEAEEKICRQTKKQFVKHPRAPWSEDDVSSEIPLPSSVLGVKKTGGNTAIH